MSDIMSDARYNSAEHEFDIGESGEPLHPTSVYPSGSNRRFRHREAPSGRNPDRGDVRENYDVSPQYENVHCDYNDHFENNSYDKNEYSGAQFRPRTHSHGTSYTVVCCLSAFIAVLNFVLPFLDWISVHFYTETFRLNCVELIEKLFWADDFNGWLNSVFGEIMSWDILPDSLSENLNTFSITFAVVKIAVLVIFALMLISLVLYFVFIILALCRAKSASGFGITASILMLLSSLAFIFGTMVLSSMSYHLFALETMPYAAAALSIILLVLSTVMSVLKRLQRRY